MAFYFLHNLIMMKRLQLAFRILFGLPLRGVRIGEDILMDKDSESEFDHTKMAPFDLSFDGVVEEPPERVLEDAAFRVCMFREKESTVRWLVLELRGKRKWHHLVTMHEARLGTMLGVLNDVEDFLTAEANAGNGPRRLPTTRMRGKTYFVDARLNELRNVSNPSDRIELRPIEYEDW